jgi:ADP-dependent NAD(P)H-hydrate dehydratase / NAD(P)H-hydrate epimerase
LKIFSSAQIKEWDSYTIAHEPISSIELMERAATACYEWLIQNNDKSFLVFCGKGNNGGDGLAVARLLLQNGCRVSAYIVESGNDGTPDFSTNLLRLQDLTGNLHPLKTPSSFPEITDTDIVIDALFGTGLNKPVGGTISALIEYINQSAETIISIDIPSGLFADKSSLQNDSGKRNSIIKADYTLTFQQYKLAFLMAENRQYFGKIILLDIGLHKNFYQQQDSPFELMDLDLIKNIYQPRDQFGHKGNYGNACLLAGSYGMMGAAVLAAGSCLRSGVGKLTCLVCKEGYYIMQASVPEAMAKVNGNEYIRKADAIENFDAIGIGPGMGIHQSHTQLLRSLFKDYKNPLVIDADALNIISQNKKLLDLIPPGSILTPHPAEFDRLFGRTKNNRHGSAGQDYERMELARKNSAGYKIFIVLKGHHTLIATPDHHVYFNSTGNAGMATGGSGDVLTGILTGIMAQGYSSLHTCLLAVYLHGLAGDIAAQKFSQEAMIAGDITACLGDAFKEVAKKFEDLKI